MTLFEGFDQPQTWVIAAEVMLKLIIAVILGGIIGWEREVHGRPAGMRTHIMLILGVVLLSEVSKVFGAGDPARIAAQIVTGVGFLGAGAILRMGLEIKGLTSAASLWAATGIGMAVSVGGPFLIIAAGATVVAIFTLEVLSKVEKRALPGGHVRELIISAKDRSTVLHALEALDQAGIKTHNIRIARTDPTVQAILALKDTEGISISVCLGIDGITEAEWMESATL
jgi:putative Mg2+ transporter-C (MgtC) family protein